MYIMTRILYFLKKISVDVSYYSNEMYIVDTIMTYFAKCISVEESEMLKGSSMERNNKVNKIILRFMPSVNGYIE